MEAAGIFYSDELIGYLIQSVFSFEVCLEDIVKMRMAITCGCRNKRELFSSFVLFSAFFCKLSFLDKCLATAQCLKILGIYTDSPQKQRESY